MACKLLLNWDESLTVHCLHSIGMLLPKQSQLCTSFEKKNHHHLFFYFLRFTKVGTPHHNLRWLGCLGVSCGWWRDVEEASAGNGWAQSGVSTFLERRKYMQQPFWRLMDQLNEYLGCVCSFGVCFWRGWLWKNRKTLWIIIESSFVLMQFSKKMSTNSPKCNTSWQLSMSLHYAFVNICILLPRFMASYIHWRQQQNGSHCSDPQVRIKEKNCRTNQSLP